MALKQSKKKAPKKEDKIVKVKWPLEEGVFDRESLLTLEKFMKKGIIHTLDYCIARGKEANVYRATSRDGHYNAIKIYRLKSPSFLHMKKYMEGDRRFDMISKGKLNVIFAWNRKEFSNLKLLFDAGINVPKPIAFKHNVLAMQFLGEGGIAYSRLCDVGPNDPKKDYQTIVDTVEKMKSIGLVHSDLSEFNILRNKDKYYIIDVGQAVLTSHPRAHEFYERDLKNIKNYFSKFIDV